VSTQPAAIEVRGLHKLYGDKAAVDGIDLTVRHGEIFALLGPNGAGKTTAVEILEGHRDRTDGEVSVLGYDPGTKDNALKSRIGIVLQETGVNPYLTVAETIGLFRGYYAHPLPLDEVIRLVGLEEQRDTRVKKLSGGQQRRLDVAVGLAGDPELLFLDEPTTGFDPAARRGAWEMVRGLQALGKTVFLTTHYMEEAEHLADRVAIIARGRIVAEDTPAGLTSMNPNTRIQFRASDGIAALVAGIEGAEIAAGYVRIETSSPTAVLASLTGRASDAGIELPELTVTHQTLEDAYLELVGEAEAAQAEADPPAGSGRGSRASGRARRGSGR
jgi:ABC-2 type transport system ATP-binding protein